MSGTLAVFTTELGAPFIDRHVLDLRPRATVAVARSGRHPLQMEAPVEVPMFRIDQWELRFSVRLARRAGVAADRMRERAVAEFLRHHRVGAVLGEYLDSFIDFVPLLDRLDIPYVAQAHGMDVSKELRQPGMRQRYLAYRSAKAVLTRNQLHRQRLIGIGLPPEKVHVNPGGIDIPDKLAAKSTGSGKRFLAVGLMVPKKAPIYLLESFRRAVERDPELSLDYVGGGALFPAAQQFVQACNLAGRVRLHGFASEETKLRLLGECGVFVQHSMTTADGDEEGLPAAIQEAMAHGLAVVSTRHSGIPEAVVEGETGLLVDEGDVERMAAVLVSIAPSARMLGEAGYRRAASCYAWEHERSRLEGWLSAA